MIGNFCFYTELDTRAITLELLWFQGEPSGVVSIPSDVKSEMEKAGVQVVTEGTLGLAYALGYGVLVAGASGLSLKLVGDQTVWPDQWGELIPVN